MCRDGYQNDYLQNAFLELISILTVDRQQEKRAGKTHKLIDLQDILFI